MFDALADGKSVPERIVIINKDRVEACLTRPTANARADCGEWSKLALGLKATMKERPDYALMDEFIAGREIATC